MELVCEGEKPGLILGILGIVSLAVPAEEGEGDSGVGLDAQDGLPDVANVGSLAGRLNCSPWRALLHLPWKKTTF